MASGVVEQQHTRDLSGTSDSAPPDLLYLLGNTLILHQTTPYLPISALLNLAATSRSFRDLLQRTPGVFRHLDLTRVKTAQFDVGAIDHGGEVWRNVQLDENITEDDFYSGPLRAIFHSIRRRNILQDVHTLILDGLSVTAELCNDILVDPSFRVRILSIREVKNLNEPKLMQSLRFACRRTRPDHMPRLKGLYVFGKKDAPLLPPSAPAAPARQAKTARGAAISSGWNHKSQHALKVSIEREGDDWYHCKGRMVSKSITEGWAETLHACHGVIQFDSVLCTGPCHRDSSAFGTAPLSPTRAADKGCRAVAQFALGGCASCGSAPEGFTVYGETPSADLPLLAPVPLHSSTVKSAARPAPDADGSNGNGGKPKFVPRCLECVRERYCFSCHQWWCELCYQVPGHEDAVAAQLVHVVDETNGLVDHEIAAFEPQKIKTRKITRSCWECESNCFDCIANTQKICIACGGGYCIIHFDGSTLTLCDWCSASRGRRVRELY